MPQPTVGPETDSDLAIALAVSQQEAGVLTLQEQTQDLDHRVALQYAADEVDHLRRESPDKLVRLLSHPSSSALDKLLEDRLFDANIRTVPHVPCVNSAASKPNDTATAHRRLKERMATYGLCERTVKGDGNCQFRAISDQLFRNPEYHAEVRATTVQQLRQYPQLYAMYVPEDYWHYCAQMGRSATWGDHVTLQATADAYGVRINVLTSFQEASFIEITPKVMMTERVLFLSFWAEVHYNSIYPVHDPPKGLPQSDNKFLGSKKLHWLVHLLA